MRRLPALVLVLLALVPLVLMRRLLVLMRRLLVLKLLVVPRPLSVALAQGKLQLRR